MKIKNKKVVYGIVIAIVLALGATGAYAYYQYNKEPEVIAVQNNICKPNIYVYSSTQKEVNIKLGLDGNITNSYPEYREYGWKVKTTSNGKIIDTTTNREYNYLFYDGKGKLDCDMTTGSVVAGKDTAAFLEDVLAKRGLNQSEIDDFITYWLPKMSENKFNLIHFSDNEYERICSLNVKPEPESLIRVYMVFKPLDNKINVKEQIIKPINRGDYTVVEWGGSELK